MVGTQLLRLFRTDTEDNIHRNHKNQDASGNYEHGLLLCENTKKEIFGFNKTEIEGWKVNISSPEKTIADCLDRPEQSGGIDEVAKAIYFNHEELDMKKIYNLAEKMGNVTILKRFGYILEKVGLLDMYKEIFSRFSPTMGYPALDPLSPKKGRHNSRWGLLVNFELNFSRWMY